MVLGLSEPEGGEFNSVIPRSRYHEHLSTKRVFLSQPRWRFVIFLWGPD